MVDVHTRAKDWTDDFLAALASKPSVWCAAVAAGVSRRAVYNRRASDPEFAARWEELIDARLDGVEAVVLERAEKGWEEPLEFQGQLTGATRHVWSESLVRWVLERRRPDSWGPRRDDQADASAAAAKTIVLADGAVVAELQRLRARIAELEGRDQTPINGEDHED